MDLSRIMKPDVMSYMPQVRFDAPKPAPKQCQCPGDVDMSGVAERVSKYKVHIEEHRTVEVGLRLNVGTGKGAKVDLEEVARAKEDTRLAGLHAVLQDFDELTEDQKNMVYAAAAFLKDRKEEGYQQLVDFVKQAKEHAKANPGQAFSLEFNFKSQDSVVIDYVEEVRERVQFTHQHGEGENESADVVQASRYQASARRVVFSQTIQFSGILMGLGEVLGDLKAGVKPESALPAPPEEAANLPKPGEATAELMKSILDRLNDPLEEAYEVPVPVEEPKYKPPSPKPVDNGVRLFAIPANQLHELTVGSA